MYVSIIIPAYNAENTIEYCLNSCLSQIDFIKEIIIVDDHSADNTVELIEKINLHYPEKIRLFKNIGKGSNAARNFGFTKATGDFIQWLDADDELGKDKLKRQVEFLFENVNYDIAYSDWILKTVNSNGFELNETNKEIQRNDFIIKLLQDEWLPPHAYLLKYDSALKITEYLGWNPETKVLQDREYFTIAALIKLNFGYVADCVVIYYRYVHIASVSKVCFEMRYMALFNIIQRVKILLATNQIKITREQINLVKSIDLLCRVQLKKEIEYPINILKIKWKIFPGRKLMFFTAFNLLFDLIFRFKRKL